MKTSVVKHSVVIGGHRTSITLEDAFWEGFQEIAKSRQETLSHLLTTINTDRRRHGGNLSSAIRLFVLYDHQHRTQKRKAA